MWKRRAPFTLSLLAMGVGCTEVALDQIATVPTSTTNAGPDAAQQADFDADSDLDLDLDLEGGTPNINKTCPLPPPDAELPPARAVRGTRLVQRTLVENGATATIDVDGAARYGTSSSMLDARRS